MSVIPRAASASITRGSLRSASSHSYELVDGHVRLAVGDLVPALDGVAASSETAPCRPARRRGSSRSRPRAGRSRGRGPPAWTARAARSRRTASGRSTPRSRRRMPAACRISSARQRVERMRGHPTSLASRSLHRLAPHREPRLAVAAERRPAAGGRRCSCSGASSSRRRCTGITTRSPTCRRGQLDAGHEHVAALAVVADQLAGLGRTLAVDDRGREPLAVEHRLEVVAHAAVDRDVGEGAALDGDDLVERHHRAPDDRAAGLDDQPGGRVEVGRAARRRSPRA